MPGRIEVEWLRKRVQTTLTARGLTHLSLDRAKGGYRYEGGPAVCEIRAIAHGEDPRAALFAEVERQLNTPFTQAERFNPFRFFVASAGDSFFLGLVYFHAVADAESVVLLLRELVEAGRGGSAAGVLPGPGPVSQQSRAAAPPTSQVVVRRLLALPMQIRNMRRSGRTPCCDAGDMTNRFSFFSLDPETWRSVVAAAKSWEVTVNDLWLALLLKSLSALAAGRLAGSTPGDFGWLHRQCPQRPGGGQSADFWAVSGFVHRHARSAVRNGFEDAGPGRSATDRSHQTAQALSGDNAGAGFRPIHAQIFLA